MRRSEYFERVAAATCSRLSAAPPGGRNVSLCREAFALGQVAHLAPDGGQQALAELCATACALGLSRREVATTATRAFQRGAGERIGLEANSAAKGVFYLNSRPANPEIAARLAAGAKAERQRQERQGAKARALWDECRPIAGTLAETYLRGRGILRMVPEAHVGFHPSGGAIGAPCCVFRVTDITGETVAVQRVPLLPDGSDRDREKGKRSLGTIGAGWLQFGDTTPATTAVCEGPEDALATWFALEDITAPAIRVVAMMLGQRWASAAAAFPGAIFVADAGSVDAAREAAASCGGRLVDPRPHGDANEMLLAAGKEALCSAIRDAEKVEAPEAQPEPLAVNAAPAHSEEALALAFATRHADDLRFVAPWGRWLRWSGAVWELDDNLGAFDLVRAICREAAAGCERPNLAHAIASAKTVAAVERLSKADRRIAATVEQWDADAWHLNTPGGIVDLRTGSRRPHRPEDYVTRITAVSPGGDCPTWLRFLADVTHGESRS